MLKRNAKITFRMNKTEQQALQKRVKKSGLSQEGYIRTVLAGSVPREPPNADFYGMMKELHAIGNRINQIAARANATGFFTRIPLNSGISQGAMSQAAARDAFLAEEYAQYVRELNSAILKIQAEVTLPERKDT